MKLSSQTLELIQFINFETKELTKIIDSILNNKNYPPPSDCCELKDAIRYDTSRIGSHIQNLKSMADVLEQEIDKLIPPQKTFKDYLDKLEK